MPYDELLASRVREIMRRRPNCLEKKMFGGIGFLVQGNMCVGLWHDSLIARIGTADYESALQEPFVVEFDITGRPMRGWVRVEPGGIGDEIRLAAWVERAYQFVLTLPAK